MNLKMSRSNEDSLWTAQCSVYNLPTFRLDVVIIRRQSVKMLVLYRRGSCACVPIWFGAKVEALTPM